MIVLSFALFVFSYYINIYLLFLHLIWLFLHFTYPYFTRFSLLFVFKYKVLIVLSSLQMNVDFAFLNASFHMFQANLFSQSYFKGSFVACDDFCFDAHLFPYKICWAISQVCFFHALLQYHSSYAFHSSFYAYLFIFCWMIWLNEGCTFFSSVAIIV